jgi:hypothetical protein
MKKIAMCVLATLAAMPAFAADNSKEKGAKPAASPGWLVIEEDFWTPLRYEPIVTLDAIRYHYRRSEEKAAANEIDKAVSWLKLAENHALPITKGKLTKAATELADVAKNLREGNITLAADMDGALGRAAQALGEWHFYKANEAWGKNEEQDAGRDLAMAAEYLQHAANSAHYEFGPDTTKVVTDFYKNVNWQSETTKFDHNTLGMHLEGIQKAIKELGEKLKKA